MSVWGRRVDEWWERRFPQQQFSEREQTYRLVRFVIIAGLFVLLIALFAAR